MTEAGGPGGGFVSVTRLRLRSPRFLPVFALLTWRSVRQAARAGGFRGGYLATEGGLGFWTITVWFGEDAMARYRAAASHGRAMPQLRDWCDEAAVTHWDDDGDAPPDLETVRARLAEDGRLSKVRHPSAAHAAGRPEGTRAALRRGPPIRPR